eukprot:5634000-Pleurochrysis_carterae.AAC.1
MGVAAVLLVGRELRLVAYPCIRAAPLVAALLATALLPLVRLREREGQHRAVSNLHSTGLVSSRMGHAGADGLCWNARLVEKCICACLCARTHVRIYECMFACMCMFACACAHARRGGCVPTCAPLRVRVFPCVCTRASARERVRARACARASVCASARVRERACARARVCASARACMYARASESEDRYATQSAH